MNHASTRSADRNATGLNALRIPSTDSLTTGVKSECRRLSTLGDLEPRIPRKTVTVDRQSPELRIRL